MLFFVGAKLYNELSEKIRKLGGNKYKEENIWTTHNYEDISQTLSYLFK